jgi:hypothetical protein
MAERTKAASGRLKRVGVEALTITRRRAGKGFSYVEAGAAVCPTLQRRRESARSPSRQPIARSGFRNPGMRPAVMAWSVGRRARYRENGIP